MFFPHDRLCLSWGFRAMSVISFSTLPIDSSRVGMSSVSGVVSSDAAPLVSNIPPVVTHFTQSFSKDSSSRSPIDASTGYSLSVSSNSLDADDSTSSGPVDENMVRFNSISSSLGSDSRRSSRLDVVV